MKHPVTRLLVVIIAFTGSIGAQENHNPIDTLFTSVHVLNTNVVGLQKLKISGYSQFQYQKTNPEFDNKKCFINRIGIRRAAMEERVRYGVGLSYCNDDVYQGTKNVFGMVEVGGVNAFSKLATNTTIGDFQKREYKGIDEQVTIETVVGLTTIPGEYVMGDQSGQAKTSTSPTTDFTKVTGSATVPDGYNRKFNGGYIYFVQSIAHNPITLVAKYDFYDPNTKVKGDEIGKTEAGQKATKAADLKYSTLGLGALLAVSNNVKVIAYYDMVTNEKSSNLSGYTKDLKDNVFTLRLQYKF